MLPPTPRIGALGGTTLFNSATMKCPTCGSSWKVQSSQAGRLVACAGCRRELTVAAALFQGERSTEGSIASHLLGMISHLLPDEQKRREAYQWLLQGVRLELGPYRG